MTSDRSIPLRVARLETEAIYDLIGELQAGVRSGFEAVDARLNGIDARLNGIDATLVEVLRRLPEPC